MSETRCLSVRQPYTWALAANVKAIENRVWSTDFRGTIALHAGSSRSGLNGFRKSTGCDLFSTKLMPVGAIIGWVDILDVQPYGPAFEDNPFAFGPYCWTMANGRFLEQPIPLKGKLNLFKLDEQTEQLLRDAKTVDTHDLDTSELVTHLTPTVDPEPAYVGLLEHWVGAGKHPDSVSIAYEWLIANAPNSPEGYAVRASLNAESRPESDTIDDYRRALDIVPDYPFALMELGYFLLDRERLSEMEPLLQRAFSVDPDCASAYIIRAEIALHRGDANSALHDSEKAIESEPKTPGGYVQAAKAHLMNSDEAQAKSALQNGLEAIPGDEWLLGLLGEIS